MFGFFLWEMVKIALTVAMLIAAPRLVTELSWPAMLVGLVVTMKASWVAVMLAPQTPENLKTSNGWLLKTLRNMVRPLVNTSFTT